MYLKPVSTIDLRDHLASYLKLVADTKTSLLIKKYRQPIAIIKPLTTKDLPLSSPDIFFGFLSHTDDETGEEFVNRLRRSLSEKNYLKKLARP
jgi:hypothetical protein